MSPRLPKPEKDILLIEDSLAHADLIRRAIESTGVPANVAHALDGAEAMNYLFEPKDGQAPPTPDLILLDLQLPKVSGMQVLEAVRDLASLKQTPVVVFTSSTARQDVDCAYKTGANSYIGKPLGFEEFQRAVRDIVAYWLDRNLRN
jgi:CheY-like chemotaxis protein